MARDVFPQIPRRRAGGSLDIEFYLRRAHELRSDDARHMAEDRRRALLKALHLRS